MTAISAALPASHSSDRARLSEAAKGFEAIFLRQLLSTARAADFGDTLFGGQGLDTFRQMQDDRFAEIASQSGAFGLAKQLEAQLARIVDSASTSSARTDVGVGTPGPTPVRPEPVEGRSRSARSQSR